MLDKFGVARALREIGSLLELEGENPFKIRAYENGARAVEGLGEDLGLLADGGRLIGVPGIGEALARKIAELHATGSTALLERLRGRNPPGVLELLRVPDLGPKKIAALRAALGISSLAELEAACAGGRVREVKGFGAKAEQKILEGVRRVQARAADRRILLSDALSTAGELLAHLRASPAAAGAELAGPARRGVETVAGLELASASPDPDALLDRLASHPLSAEVLARGPDRAAVRLASGLPVELRVVPAEDLAPLLLHLTGSAAHLTKLAAVAHDRGYALDERGLRRLPPDAPAKAALAAGEATPEPAPRVPVASEAELYRTLGLPFIPPELREDQGEIEAALAGALPDDLIRAEDVRGMVHCHTVWSDGRATVEEMARAAEALGAEYLTITDHSGAAAYAGGLDRDRLLRQWDEIDRVQERVGIRLLKGSEADILEDGALDWPDDVLERLEVVVASIHSRMRMDEDQMTRRLVRAMSLPVFKIWGHGLGRLLGEREPYACRVEEILDALARSRGAVEVNGDPRRLDLEPRWIRAARERGIPLVASVDAHSTAALGYLPLAIATARRGWARRGDVLNALPAAEFARAVRPVS